LRAERIWPSSKWCGSGDPSRARVDQGSRYSSVGIPARRDPPKSAKSPADDPVRLPPPLLWFVPMPHGTAAGVGRARMSLVVKTLRHAECDTFRSRATGIFDKSGFGISGIVYWGQKLWSVGPRTATMWKKEGEERNRRTGRLESPRWGRDTEGI